jgi:hypothetical protein
VIAINTPLFAAPISTFIDNSYINNSNDINDFDFNEIWLTMV